MFNNKLQTRTKDYYAKSKELKKLVIAVRQKQERIINEQKEIIK
mgnify:CR=1 FL=1|tara:strand:- start:658 stop:789 length:132 start_codon:yes stop_codon:yes gene_type:complete